MTDLLLRIIKQRIGWLLLLCALAGCHAQRPDISAATARLTGLDNAIVFRSFAEPLVAQPATGTLTPEQAVRLALLHDPRVQSAMAKVRVAEAEANQPRLLPNPILGIDIRFPAAPNASTVFEPTLAADLVSLLSKPALISAADNRLRGAAADAVTTVLDVIAEVQQAYAGTRSVDNEIANSQRRLDLLQQLRTLAQKRLDAGDATRLDVLTLDSQLMQSTLAISDFQLQRATERLTLARLVGQPLSNGEWELSPWAPPPMTSIAPESAWIDAAMLNRPEITSKVWELKALGGDLTVAALAPLQGGEVGVHAERDPAWRVGPTLLTPLPLFDWGQAGRAKVKALTIAARHDLALQRFLVIQDVRIAYATYINAQRSLADAQTKLLPLQQKQLEQARLSYQAGEVDLTTLLLAETDLEITLSKIIELQEKVTVAVVKLQRAAGGAAVFNRVNAATQPAHEDSK
jgi:outer membrane protein TolC